MTGSMPWVAASLFAHAANHRDDTEAQRGHPVRPQRLAQEHGGWP